MGLQSFSHNVPCPVATEVVQRVQAIFSTPKPSSAHASVMVTGRTLSRCGALTQSATTPGRGVVDGAELVVALADDGGTVDPRVVVVLTGVAVGAGGELVAVLTALAPQAAVVRPDPSSAQIVSATCEGRIISVSTDEPPRRLCNPACGVAARDGYAGRARILEPEARGC